LPTFPLLLPFTANALTPPEKCHRLVVSAESSTPIPRGQKRLLKLLMIFSKVLPLAICVIIIGSSIRYILMRLNLAGIEFEESGDRWRSGDSAKVF
jgi:hypothetical protein